MLGEFNMLGKISPTCKNVVSEVSVSRKNAKAKANVELKIRNEKVNSLKEAIQYHINNKGIRKYLKNLSCVFSTVIAAGCIGGTLYFHNAVNKAEQVDDKEKLEHLCVGLGSAMTFTLWSLKALVGDLSRISIFENDDTCLLDNKGFHEFVIDKCKINADWRDIKALKNMYSRHLDSKIDAECE